MEKYASLSVNSNKSKIYFSKEVYHKEDILKLMNFKEGNLPVKYLGLPLSINQINERDCSRLFDIIHGKLEGWSSKFLSLAGRMKLTHTAITAVIIYWTKAHNIPINVIQKVEKMCSNFIWKGKHHKIAWDKVCKPKKFGGLGLRNIRDISEVCKFKLFWKFLDGKSLWARWMRDKYLKNKKIWISKKENHHSYVWKNILDYRDICRKLIDRKLKVKPAYGLTHGLVATHLLIY